MGSRVAAVRRTVQRAAKPFGGAALPQSRALYWLALVVIVAAVVSFLDDARTALSLSWPQSAFRLVGSASLSGTLIAVALQRRWLPVWLAAVGGLLGLVSDRSPVVFAVAIALPAAAFRNDRRATAALGGVYLAARLGEAFVEGRGHGWVFFVELPFMAVLGVLGWALGNTVRRRQLAETRVKELAAQAEQARERERSLLARELHDVVAHELTIITMQASLMRMTTEPAQLAEARDAIERTSRTALDELKRLLRVLRTSDVIDDADAAAPREVPVVVDSVVERLRSLGHPVEAYCEVGPLPRSVELAADRVLREAATNIVKHAVEGAACRIDARERDGALHLEVSNTLTAPEPSRRSEVKGALPSTRLGLPGLEERLRILGGTFEAFADGERWIMRAVLPLAPPESAELVLREPADDALGSG